MLEISKAHQRQKLVQVIASLRTRHGLPQVDPGADPEPGEDRTAPLKISAEHRDNIRLCFLIYDVARLHRSAYDEFMKPLGMTRAEWSVLAQLSRQDGMVQSRLAELLEISRCAVGIIINSLEASGWIERRDDPFDRRVKRVYLARHTQSLIQQMSILASHFGNRILGSLSDADRSALSRMLLAVKQDIDHLAPSPMPLSQLE